MTYQGTLFLTNDFIQSVINSDYLDSQYEATKALFYEKDKLASLLALSKPEQYDNILGEMMELFGTKSPISMLMEYMQYSKSRVNFIEVAPPEGPDHKPVFTLVAVVDGHPYMRVQAKTKKDARTGAAYMAWKSIISEEQDKLIHFIERDLPLEDHITCKVCLEYLTQVLKNPMIFCGRKILSAIVMVDRSKLENGSKIKNCKVISLGTGNRCISSQHLSLDGLSVNDSHAEVITRRAFLRFLHDEITRYSSGEDTIFAPRESSDDLEVKSTIEFHLYISALPCGDASVFSKEKFKSNDPSRSIENYDEDAEEPIFDSMVQGLLRTKIEAGEGAIPAERSHLQSWVGLMFGNRLRTMCCSDKILKWNVVGLQGALLSQIIKPIYLSSVIVGEGFIRGHVTRALYHRLVRNEIVSLSLSEQSNPALQHSSIDDLVPDLHLPAPYRPTNPAIIKSNFVNLFQQQETEKSSALAVVWYLGLDKAEVFDGTTGKFPNENNLEEHPCVCKKLLFESFKSVMKCLHKNNNIIPCLDNNNNSDNNNDNNNNDNNNNNNDNNNSSKVHLDNRSYYKCKQQVTHYQQAKRTFFRHMEMQDLGGWITKPIEIDFFD